MGKKKGGKAGKEQREASVTQASADADDTSPASLKARGNAAVGAGDHALAHELFTTAIELGPPADEAHLYYSNRSLCALALGSHDQAVADANECIRLQPAWSKGHARLGAAHLGAGRHAEAVRAYAAGLVADPTATTLLDSLGTAQKELVRRQQEAERVQKQKQTQKPTPTPAPAPAPTEATVRGGGGPVIGIDLGTTYSCVAVVRPGAGRVEVIPNADGGRTTPSWVAFSASDGTRLVGQAAKNQAASNPSGTVCDAKRLIGRGYNDAGVQADLKHFSCAVECGEGGKPLLSLGGSRKYAPEQISAMVLEQLKADAEAFLGEPVSRAVITVPAHFNDAQRQATKDAGTIAGLSVLRIINEPTAAALAYGLDKGDADGGAKEKRVLIFDLGGGTFDVSVLSIEEGIFEVGWLSAQFGKAHKGALPLGERATRRLFAAAERAKRQLSSATTSELEVEALKDGHDLAATLTRAKFESLNSAHFSSCLDTVKGVLRDSGLGKEDIDDVVLVGGSTRIPKIRDSLSEFFGGKALCASINPDEAVAYGAAVQAGVLGGGLEAAGGALAKASASLVLVDVVPLSLGIETTGRVMSTVVKRNTQIPCRKSDTFTTEEDWQTEVDIDIYEGERASTDACNKLGHFRIAGLQRAKRGEPQVVVTFDIDANGILAVSAVDKHTNAKASITISTTSARNSPADVARMVEEARACAAADAALRRKADARRALEDAVYDVIDDDDASDDAKAAAAAAEEWLRDAFEKVGVREIEERVQQIVSRR